MNLYLLRHGIAVDPSVPDFANDAERPLTPKGRNRMRQIAAAMGALNLSFDVILSSPFVRARQTAEIVVKSLKCQKKLRFTDELTTSGNPKLLIQQVYRLIKDYKSGGRGCAYHCPASFGAECRENECAARREPGDAGAP